MLPRDQPARALRMLQAFLDERQPSSFTPIVGGKTVNSNDATATYHNWCDTSDGICYPSDVASVGLGGVCALLYNCSGHGTCIDTSSIATTTGVGVGQCQCHDGYTGVDCTHPIGIITVNPTTTTATTTISVPTDAWHYHDLDIIAPEALKTVVVTLQHQGKLQNLPVSGLTLYALRIATQQDQSSSSNEPILPTKTSYTVSWQIPVSIPGSNFTVDLEAASPQPTTSGMFLV